MRESLLELHWLGLVRSVDHMGVFVDQFDSSSISGAYAMTRDLNRMFRLGESLESGSIGINDGAPTTSNCPFGGVKQSGWGRELGSEGLDAYLETKHVSIGGVL